MKNRIKELRQEKKMTQVRLSIELEVSQETVSAYESGKYYPSYQTLLKLSGILNSSIDYLMGLSNVRHPQFVHLSEDEKQVLGLYSGLSDRQKERVLGYLQGLQEQ